MRCVLYARYSTDRQNEASTADQLRVCREFAAARGWTVAGEHVDEGISGAALGNRPGARAAIAALERGDALVVVDLSRLSRSQDLGPLLSRLTHRGARVLGAQDGYDSTAPTARMQAGMSGIMSEEFRAMIAARTRSALELRAREQRPTGGRAYDNVAILREIFARAADGETLRAIASDLNLRGIPSPGASWKKRGGTRGRWLVSAIFEILRNERYNGRVIWNRSQWFRDPDTGRRVRRMRPREQWVVRETQAVIDDDTWQRVQRRMRKNVGSGRGGVRRYLLSGILECALCGAKLIVVGGSQRRYVCGTYHGGGEHACANDSSLPRLVAERMILEPVLEQLLTPAMIQIGVKELREARRDAERAPHPARAEIAELERLVREGILSRDVAAPAIAEARRQAEQVLELPWPSESLWREAVAGAREILAGDDVAAARDLLGELLGAVRCRPAAAGLVLAELPTGRVLMAAGAARGIWVGSGGAIPIYIPTSTRPGAAPTPSAC